MNSETPDTTGLIAGIIDVFAESPLSGNPLAVVEGWPADPQSWNRYAYVRNDPVNLTDPSGKFWGFLIHLFVALFTPSDSSGRTWITPLEFWGKPRSGRS